MIQELVEEVRIENQPFEAQIHKTKVEATTKKEEIDALYMEFLQHKQEYMDAIAVRRESLSLSAKIKRLRRQRGGP